MSSHSKTFGPFDITPKMTNVTLVEVMTAPQCKIGRLICHYLIECLNSNVIMKLDTNGLSGVKKILVKFVVFKQNMNFQRIENFVDITVFFYSM